MAELVSEEEGDVNEEEREDVELRERGLWGGELKSDAVKDEVRESLRGMIYRCSTCSAILTSPTIGALRAATSFSHVGLGSSLNQASTSRSLRSLIG